MDAQKKMSDTGDNIEAKAARWSFGGDVPLHFDEHVAKSVPFYHEGHDLVARLSDFYLPQGGVCYEIGCSTGRLTKLIGERNADTEAIIVGIDVDAEMVKFAGERCKDMDNVQILQADAQDFEFEPASLIVAYYTMQFVQPRVRQLLFDKIYNALEWGGAFIMFEKVRAPDARFQDIATALYTEFKLDEGYNEQQIVQKTRSLTGVLEPFSTAGNLDLLKRAGFDDFMTVFKYVCFEGFLAIK